MRFIGFFVENTMVFLILPHKLHFTRFTGSFSLRSKIALSKKSYRGERVFEDKNRRFLYSKARSPLKKPSSPAFRAKRKTGRKKCTVYLQKDYL